MKIKPKTWIKFTVIIVLAAFIVTTISGCDVLSEIMQYLGANFQMAGEINETAALEEDLPEQVFDDLPERDFGGYEFTILSPSETRYSKDIDAFELTGAIFNDAVYYRNRNIEKRYNVKIAGDFKDEPYNWAKRTIMSGIDEWDLFALPMDMSAQMAPQGFFCDFYNVPFIDFEKPWWDKNANRQLSLADKLYFTPNALLTSDKDAASVVLFSKNICVDYGLDNPYQLVMDGQWTVDKMHEMAESATVDLNGDGNLDAINDKFGLLAGYDTFYNGVISSGGAVIIKSANDFPTAELSERTFNAFYKWINIYDKYCVWTNTADFKEMFDTNRGLFMYETMANVPNLRRYEIEFGILPYPKFDVTEPYYINPAGVSGAVIAVPLTYTDIGRTGIILEALTAESYHALMQAYYDFALKAQYYRDDESEIMLDIIFGGRRYNLGLLYNINNIDDTFNGLAAENNTNLVSAYDKIEFLVNQSIRQITENILALN